MVDTHSFFPYRTFMVASLEKRPNELELSHSHRSGTWPLIMFRPARYLFVSSLKFPSHGTQAPQKSSGVDKGGLIVDWPPSIRLADTTGRGLPSFGRRCQLEPKLLPSIKVVHLSAVFCELAVHEAD